MKALAQGTLFVVFAVVAGLVGLVVWIGWELSLIHISEPTRPY